MPKTPVELPVPRYTGPNGNDFVDEDLRGLTLTREHFGLNGNDTFLAAAHDGTGEGQPFAVHFNDLFDGGSGTDTVSYLLSEQAIVANLGTGVAQGTQSGVVQFTDTLVSIKGLVGSAHADTVHGSSAANQLLGDSGNDAVSDGNGNDTLSGGTGNDDLGGDSGDDDLDGGTGTDTAVYTGAGAAVTVSLQSGSAFGGEGSDDLTGLENVETGGGDDPVFGNGAANVLAGGGGAGLLMGEGGADVVQGGSGHDVVDGGSGADVLYGGSGDNLLHGWSENDSLISENGAEEFDGGPGDDVLAVGSGAGDIVWGEGDAGYDIVIDLNMAEDQFVLEAGFLALGVGVGDQPEDALMVFDTGADAVLAAEWGWVEIAVIENVDAYQLGQGITNGSLVGDGGGLVFG